MFEITPSAGKSYLLELVDKIDLTSPSDDVMEWHPNPHTTIREIVAGVPNSVAYNIYYTKPNGDTERLSLQTLPTPNSVFSVVLGWLAKDAEGVIENSGGIEVAGNTWKVTNDDLPYAVKWFMYCATALPQIQVEDSPTVQS